MLVEPTEGFDQAGLGAEALQVLQVINDNVILGITEAIGTIDPAVKLQNVLCPKTNLGAELGGLPDEAD